MSSGSWGTETAGSRCGCFASRRPRGRPPTGASAPPHASGTAEGALLRYAQGGHRPLDPVARDAPGLSRWLLDEQVLRRPRAPGFTSPGRHPEVRDVQAVRLDPAADVRVVPTDHLQPEMPQHLAHVRGGRDRLLEDVPGPLHPHVGSAPCRPRASSSVPVRTASSNSSDPPPVAPTPPTTSVPPSRLLQPLLGVRACPHRVPSVPRPPVRGLVRSNESFIGRSRTICGTARTGCRCGPFAGASGQTPRSLMILATWPVALTL